MTGDDPLRSPAGKFRLYESELWLSAPREKVFQFFSDAANLETITPDWLKFEILTPLPVKMKAGTLLDYRIHLRWFPLRWRTRIEVWEPPARFVDTQVRGPYVLWHHTHSFRERDGGTVCRDEVRYWPRGGALIDWLFVRRDVRHIFDFRAARLREIFRSER